MGRNQNRIEGEYAIVSVFRQGRTGLANHGAHNVEMALLLKSGGIIEQLRGRWNGQDELSIRVYGPNSAAVAAEIALEYDQEAFLVVGGGVATLWGRTDAYLAGEALFEPIETYTSLIEDADATDNYSETMGGFRFRFV